MDVTYIDQDVTNIDQDVTYIDQGAGYRALLISLLMI